MHVDSGSDRQYMSDFNRSAYPLAAEVTEMALFFSLGSNAAVVRIKPLAPLEAGSRHFACEPGFLLSDGERKSQARDLGEFLRLSNGSVVSLRPYSDYRPLWLSLSVRYRDLLSQRRREHKTMPAVKAVFQTIIDSEEPLTSAIYGNRYRCACTLRDGTYLPCVVLQSRSKLVALAKRRISEEKEGKGKIAGTDPYGQIVSSFVSRNWIADYDMIATLPFHKLCCLRSTAKLG
jgi:hypothetical protein